MARIAILSLAVVTAALSSGCGTVANTVWLIPEEGGKKVYGGVKADIEMVHDCSVEACQSEDFGGRMAWTGKAIAMAIDVAFSALGDTLTLPITIPASIDGPIDDFYLRRQNQVGGETADRNTPKPVQDRDD